MIARIEGLELVYDSGQEKLKVLDVPAWSLEQGEQVAIYGPSGSGKSTFLHVLAGLLLPTRGTVEVCGYELHALSESARDRYRAEHIGYIFQNFNLLQGYTALENILLGMTFSRKKPDRALAEDLLRKAGIWERRKHYPSQMSIGEQQRVAVARALANRPKLILADEPTASLDPLHADGVMDTLREICRTHGCSLVLVSHETQVIGKFEKAIPFMELNRAFARKGGAS